MLRQWPSASSVGLFLAAYRSAGHLALYRMIGGAWSMASDQQKTAISYVDRVWIIMSMFVAFVVWSNVFSVQ